MIIRQAAETDLAGMTCHYYGEFVRNARLTAAGEIDRSAVDFAWAATALKRGNGVETVMAELERVSLKAAGLGERARRA